MSRETEPVRSQLCTICTRGEVRVLMDSLGTELYSPFCVYTVCRAVE